MKFSFALKRSTFTSSVFCEANTYEVVNPDMLNGFVVNKMGIKFHKTGKYKGMPYANELILIQNYQKNHVSDGKVSVKYGLSKHRWGRIQPAGSLSLSLFHRPTRHSLCMDTYVDFDMVNCQPSIVNQVCLQNGISNARCIEYCNDPKTWRYMIAREHNLKPIFNKDKQVTIQPYEQAKKLFISLSFGGSYSAWRKTYNAEGVNIPEIVEMETELKHVMTRIWEDNQAMIDDVVSANENWNKKHTEEKKRSIMGLWAQSLERMVQETCICSIVENIGFVLGAIVPCQDGFMILKSELERCRTVFENEANILEGMGDEIKRMFDFDINWEVKPFNEPLASGIPLVKKEDISAALSNENSFEYMCAEFEKTHCKIINTGSYVKHDIDGDVVMPRQLLTAAYEHMRYTAIVKGEQKRLSFINTWLANPDIRRKRVVGIYPHDIVCPDDVYNSWSPFAMEKVESYVRKPEAVEVIRKHISILCKHDTYTISYFSKWIACMIQYPSIKLTMPCFVSTEGGGKGSLLRLFSAMLGSSKILNTQNPSETVWGQFNGMMLNTYLVCLDEISKKEMAGSEGKIKGLITEPTMTINGKGKERFSIDSYHKFISFSNPDAYGNEPMTTTDGDRRKWFVQCSDELVGNKAYFDNFYKILADTDAIKTIFEYYKSLPDANSILGMALPVSAYSRELKELAISPIKRFMTDYVSANSTVDKVSTIDLFAAFNSWTEAMKIKYDCSAVAFGCRLANLNIMGMSKVSNMGVDRVKGWSFDLPTIKYSLGISSQSTMLSFDDQ